MDLQFDFPPTYVSSANSPRNHVVVTPAPVASVILETRNLSIMSYELKFSPGGYYSHLKPDPKHPVYDP